MSVLRHVPRISAQDPLNKLYSIRKNDFSDLSPPVRSREIRPYASVANIVCLGSGSQVDLSEVKLVISGSPSERLSLGLLARRTPGGIVDRRPTRSISIRQRKWGL
jgi:hypothetical protein